MIYYPFTHFSPRSASFGCGYGNLPGGSQLSDMLKGLSKRHASGCAFFPMSCEAKQRGFEPAYEPPQPGLVRVRLRVRKGRDTLGLGLGPVVRVRVRVRCIEMSDLLRTAPGLGGWTHVVLSSMVYMCIQPRLSE